MQGRIITISRQCGSGGHTIGGKLAQKLDVPFYDKEIIEMTAKESGFHQQFVEEKGEHMESGMLSNLTRRLSYAGRGGYYQYYTDKKWGEAFHYHLCLDSGMFGVSKCVSMIEDACKTMYPTS